METACLDVPFLEQAVERYADMILRIAYQNLKNQADAEDVAQQVFLKLIGQPTADFHEEEHLKAWLIRVTVNLCKDHWKSAWRRRTVPLPEPEEVWQPPDAPRQEVLEQLWLLPQNYRNVLYLYSFEGYSLPEIGRLLDKKENTVRSQLTRGRRRLRDLLREE